MKQRRRSIVRGSISSSNPIPDGPVGIAAGASGEPIALLRIENPTGISASRESIQKL